MSARTKLNGIVFAGILLFASLVGLGASSWLLFVIVTIVLTVLMIHSGEVRINANDRPFAPRRTSKKWNRH